MYFQQYDNLFEIRKMKIETKFSKKKEKERKKENSFDDAQF